MMMSTRRVLAAFLVAAPTVAATIVLMQWRPLPHHVGVQWFGAEVTNTQPVWMLFIPTSGVTLLGLAMAIAAVIDRDRNEPHRGTFYVAAVLTAASGGVCVAILAINLDFAEPNGPAFLGTLAFAPAYALLPLAIVGIRSRRATERSSTKIV
ncbi:hypothetical protein [Agromyces silvae]|uniref:hypothetical protein n=1 Tax=Agromyces silvae TaxID=3388266 RepID=UPI00280AED65|nr:hypothetical protein [Agromyces protaetiae]